MTDVNEHGRPEPPLTADRISPLVGFLDYLRVCLAWRWAGLEPAELQRSVGVFAATVGSSTAWSALGRVA